MPQQNIFNINQVKKQAFKLNLSHLTERAVP